MAEQHLNIAFHPMTQAAAVTLGSAFARIDPWAHYRFTADALAGFLSQREDGAPRFEIHLDARLAGTIVLRQNWLFGPYLQFLAILPEYQGRGLGHAALRWFEDQARTSKASNMWVAATAFNARALALYEGFGFVRVAELDSLIEDGTNEILLRKRLA
jgi:diamine N-acetyltransferase